MTDLSADSDRAVAAGSRYLLLVRPTPVEGGGTLERERELATLVGAAREAATSRGSVALVSGEAGIGKTTVVRDLVPLLPRGARFLLGSCDDLSTRRTLGPFRDLVGSVGAELGRAVQEASDRDRVLAALRSELARAPHPTVLVVEDVHWADDATLDALHYLVRRVAQMPALLVLTFRDDELGRDHPLHDVLAAAHHASQVHHLRLERLSRSAVGELSGDAGVDPDPVYAVTAGNPFFVTEVLAVGGVGVPPTVRESVLARVRKLDRSTRDLVEQLSVVPSAPQLWLVDRLAGLGGHAALAAAEEHGLLDVSPERIAFRHELTRRAIADSLPASYRIELNQTVLDALLAHGEADLSRLVHHAREAGDTEAVLRFAPHAAREAAGAGAHREAAAHYRLLLDHGDRLSDAERADLLEAYAVECYTLGAAADAVEAQVQAVDLRERLGDASALGASLRWLSRMHWWAGGTVQAEQAARRGIEVLERGTDTRQLAMALSNRAQLLGLGYHCQEAIEVGRRAAALAREVGDRAVLAHALTNVGMSQSTLGDPAGYRVLEEARDIALAAGETDHALRAYVAAASGLLDEFRLTEAADALDASIELADRAEQVAYLRFLQLERARLHLLRGDWAGVWRDATWGLDSAQPPLRWGALLAIGRMQLRRGHDEGEPMLREGLALGVVMAELQRTAPMAAALAEAAWLRGELADVLRVAKPAYVEARELGALAHEVELGWWLGLAGDEVTMPSSDLPYAILADGRWQDAATAFDRAGAPYERALAIFRSDDPDSMLAALDGLDALGVEPLARRYRRRLRELGVAHVPRGPSRTTRAHVAGLTARQTEVLRLLGDGLSNAEIADRLVVSVRTVDSHVSAVLAKLGVHSRQEAARLGRVDATR